MLRTKTVTRFLAIDFETADNYPDSACSIGLVLVENGRIVKEVMKLIRPPRSQVHFTHIHGLRWEDLCDSPGFGLIWPEIAPLFEGLDFLAAHNASFDKRVLLACCQAHGITLPEIRFECTVQLARKAFGIYPTKLSNVCQQLKLELNHHEALSDARACANIVIQAMNKSFSEAQAKALADQAKALAEQATALADQAEAVTNQAQNLTQTANNLNPPVEAAARITPTVSENSPTRSDCSQ